MNLHAIVCSIEFVEGLTSQSLVWCTHGSVLFVHQFGLLEFELIDAFLSLLLLFDFDDVELLPLRFEVGFILIAQVQINFDSACIFGLEAEAVNYVWHAVFVQVLGSDELF